MIVLDASAVLELLLRTPPALVEPVLGDHSLEVPHVLDLEILTALQHLVTSEQLTAERALAALEDLQDLGLQRWSQEPMLERIWDLRASLTARDAHYLVLAETLEARLYTLDVKLARSTGHGAEVVLLSRGTVPL